MLPVHCPEAMVTLDGEIRPSPKLVSWRSRRAPENPLTMTPFGSRAVMVIASGTPAVWFFAMLEISRLWSTIDCTEELVPSEIVPSDWSCAKIVKLPPAFRITRKFAVPPESWAGAGSDALASEASIWIVCVTEGTRAQVLSHALTVTVKGTPAVWACGVPVLPEGVPGAADSPGS